MHRTFAALLSAFAVSASVSASLGAMSGTAAAQSFTGSETFYGEVRGWGIFAYATASGAFNGCGALKEEAGQKVLLALGTNGIWELVVPTSQTGTFGGGILDIDKISIDSQFGFVGGFAIRELSVQEIGMIKAGSQLGVVINGDGPERWWSLSGSTAAMLKATECVQRGGRAVAAAVPASPSPSPSPSPSGGSDLLYPVPVGETQVGDCKMGFTDVYRCTFEGLNPKAGYRTSTRVVDAFGSAPTLDLDAVSATEADVWALMDGNWSFMGRWRHDTSMGRCLVPGDNQTPEAINNLGQDAWMICLP